MLDSLAALLRFIPQPDHAGLFSQENPFVVAPVGMWESRQAYINGR